MPLATSKKPFFPDLAVTGNVFRSGPLELLFSEKKSQTLNTLPMTAFKKDRPVGSARITGSPPQYI
jgi:hypothetical protein